MAVGKGDPGRPVVIGGGIINPRSSFQLRSKVADVVDAVGMLVHIHPSFSRAGIVQAGHLTSKIGIISATPSIGVVADANVAGNTAHSFRFAGPACFARFVFVEPFDLVGVDVNIRRAFEEIFGFGEIRSQLGILGIQQVVYAEVFRFVVPSH